MIPYWSLPKRDSTTGSLATPLGLSASGRSHLYCCPLLHSSGVTTVVGTHLVAVVVECMRLHTHRGQQRTTSLIVHLPT